MPLTYNDLWLAYELVSSGAEGQYEAFVCRKTGKIYLHAEFGDPFPDEHELPEDLDENE